MRARKLATIVIVLTATLAGAALTQSAHAGNGSVKYTHGSTLTQPTCTIHANYPKAGVPDWGWPKAQQSPRGKLNRVGVRYTVGAYALVLDYGRKGEPSWGFIAKSCLADPYAYDGAGHRLPDRRAVGGNGKPKTVLMSAPHKGKHRRALIHASETGTLRNAGKSFVIGNVQKGDPFYITKSRCGKHSAKAWILGYAPKSGRWGYVQAAHLPACR